MDEPVAQGGGVCVSVDDVQLMMKLGACQSLLDQILLRKIAAALAGRHNIGVSDEQVDIALAELYANLELFESSQVSAWLEAMKLGEQSLRQYLQESLLRDAVREVAVPDDAVRQRFSASPYDYTELQVQKITIDGQGAAAEVTLQLKESEITWEQAAAVAGGMTQETFRRQDAPAEAAAALYAAELGDFVGPVEDAMDTYCIYRVAWKIEPELTDELREEIREQLFDELLRTALSTEPPRFVR